MYKSFDDIDRIENFLNNSDKLKWLENIGISENTNSNRRVTTKEDTEKELYFRSPNKRKIRERISEKVWERTEQSCMPNKS